MYRPAFEYNVDIFAIISYFNLTNSNIYKLLKGRIDMSDISYDNIVPIYLENLTISFSRNSEIIIGITY